MVRGGVVVIVVGMGDVGCPGRTGGGCRVVAGAEKNRARCCTTPNPQLDERHTNDHNTTNHPQPNQHKQNNNDNNQKEYHVDGFRFDLASIMTRAHSAWHPQEQPLAATAAPEGPLNGAGANGHTAATAAAAAAAGPPLAPLSPGEGSPMGPIVDDNGVMTDGAGVPTGAPLSSPPLIEAISGDPVLR